ncbi:cupin domain-containing protein [Mycobacteroides abscessus]|uniref:cupin domain-containing protein n=1 Tax=Mycobacteroides abscessus TaxID=36809 RepID=UPI000C26947E|nr:cupin domain-containing protein [Mycobacteroides abscessus]
MDEGPATTGINRRNLLWIAAAIPAMATLPEGSASATPIDPRQTFVLQPDEIDMTAWLNLPPDSGQMAKLYGDSDKPGPYLVLMRWNPGWFSAPHSYATDRIQMVISGTWHVNSGTDFDPVNTVPVRAGGFVSRTARTYHYDGVPSFAREPAVVAVFGIGPVDLQLADPNKPSWRQF